MFLTALILGTCVIEYQKSCLASYSHYSNHNQLHIFAKPTDSGTS